MSDLANLALALVLLVAALSVPFAVWMVYRSDR